MLVSQTGGGGLRPGMPVVTRMRDGHYLEVTEIVGIDNAAVLCKISLDDTHWPPGLGAPIDLQHACPWVVSLTDGQLLVTSCSNQISTSEDYRRTWS